ncbi:helix-hairpin-helix domain-containing protein [Elusimicrobiota bacterium]
MKVKYIYLFVMIAILCSGSLKGARRLALVDVNTAWEERFVKIPGISKTVATNIVEYRDKHGYFEEIQDLINVIGINQELFEEIEPFLTITSGKDIEAQKRIQEIEESQELDVVDFKGETDTEVLERFRVDPLDINTATLDQLVELPYVNEEIAEDIIKYRRKHRGFSSVDELSRVVSSFVLDNIYPFIEVRRSRELEKFHGDMRFRYGVWPYPFGSGYFNVDEKYHNPQYFYSRYRMYYGNKSEVGLVLRKDRNSLELNMDNIRDYFLIKKYMLVRNALTLDTLIIGDYKLSFGQGIFVQPGPFLIRQIPRKPKGLKEDSGTHFNEGFYGLAGVKRFSGWEVYSFYSNKPIIVSYLNQDGSVGTPPTEFYSYYSTYLSAYSESHYEHFGDLMEQVYGSRVKYSLTGNLDIGGGYYKEEFDPYIDPAQKAYIGGGKYMPVYLLSDYYFRGDKVNLTCLDAEYHYRNLGLYLEWGRSNYHTFDREVRERDEYADKDKEWYWDYGDAYQALAIMKYQLLSFWLNYHWIEYDYFAFHSSPWTLGLGEETFIRDEKGYIIGGKYSGKKIKTQLSLKYGRPIIPPRFYSSTTGGLASWAAKDEFEIYWDNTWNALKKFTVKYRNTYTIKERTRAFGEPASLGDIFKGDDFYLYLPYHTMKNRMELIHEASDSVRLKWRYETINNTYPEINTRMYGYTTFGELKYKPTTALTIYSRITYWDAPKGISAGAMEYTWPNALIPYTYYSVYGATEKSYRWYIMPTLRFSRDAKLWAKYEYWPNDDGADKSVFKLQYDFSW